MAIKLFKNSFLSFWLTINLFFAKFVLAQDSEETILGQLKRSSAGAGFGETEPTSDTFAQSLGMLLGLLLGFLGVIFMGLALYGGWMWMSARGNTERVDKAKKIITEAITGLVVIMAAYAISRYVVGAIATATKHKG